MRCVGECVGACVKCGVSRWERCVTDGAFLFFIDECCVLHACVTCVCIYVSVHILYVLYVYSCVYVCMYVLSAHIVCLTRISCICTHNVLCKYHVVHIYVEYMSTYR